MLFLNLKTRRVMGQLVKRKPRALGEARGVFFKLKRGSKRRWGLRLDPPLKALKASLPLAAQPASILGVEESLALWFCVSAVSSRLPFSKGVMGFIPPLHEVLFLRTSHSTVFSR
jgi:hypothetical protein